MFKFINVPPDVLVIPFALEARTYTQTMLGDYVAEKNIQLIGLRKLCKNIYV